jgi:predicted DNA-binding ribbon-helix-helix protein
LVKAQKEHRQRFKEAVAYARADMAEPKVSNIYEKRAAKENRRSFRVAVSDYLKGNDLLSKK